MIGDHARAFAWLILIIGTFLVTMTGVQGVLVHFFLGNPNKIQQQALLLAISLTFDFLIATLGLFLVAGASQTVVAVVATLLARHFGRRTQARALLTIPAVAILTWCCFDYLTRSNMVLIPGPDFVPYQHGLTLSRYAKITAFQTVATTFTVIYATNATKKIRRWLPLACCGAACIVGAGLAAVRDYPLWAQIVAARQTISEDIEEKTIPIAEGSSIRTIDWTPDGRAILVRMILPDEIVMVREDGQSTMKIPPNWSLNAVSTVGTVVFTTEASPYGSYLESLDLTNMSVQRRLIDNVPNEDASERPQAYIGTSRSVMAIPFMSPYTNVRDRPHIVDLYNGSTLAKIASFRFAVGQTLPGLVSISEDGKVAAYSLPTSSGAGAIEIRSLPDGAVIGKLEGRFGAVVALSPNGKTVAAVEERFKSGSVGEPSKWISVFDIKSQRLFGGREIMGACKVQRTEGDPCRDYLPPMWSPDGSFVAYGDGLLARNTLHIWHPFGENIVDRDVTIKVPFNIISLSPDGSAVAVDDFHDSVTIIRSKNGKPL